MNSLLIPTDHEAVCANCSYRSTASAADLEASIVSLANTLHRYVAFKSFHEIGAVCDLGLQHFQAALRHGPETIFGVTYDLASRNLISDWQYPQALEAWQTNVH